MENKIRFVKDRFETQRGVELNDGRVISLFDENNHFYLRFDYPLDLENGTYEEKEYSPTPDYDDSVVNLNTLSSKVRQRRYNAMTHVNIMKMCILMSSYTVQQRSEKYTTTLLNSDTTSQAMLSSITFSRGWETTSQDTGTIRMAITCSLRSDATRFHSGYLLCIICVKTGKLHIPVK